MQELIFFLKKNLITQCSAIFRHCMHQFKPKRRKWSWPRFSFNWHVDTIQGAGTAVA